MAVLQKVARVRYLGVFPKVSCHLTEFGLALVHDTPQQDKSKIYGCLAKVASQLTELCKEFVLGNLTMKVEFHQELTVLFSIP